MHGIHWEHSRIRIFRGMSTQFPHFPTVNDGHCSGLIISRPLSNRIGLGSYPCPSNASSESFSPADPFSCPRAHGRLARTLTLPARSNSGVLSWLIDNDRDADGMQVIADLYGGDLGDASAKAVFREIKDRVNFDVS